MMDGIIISEGAFAPLSCSAYLPHLVDLSTIIAVAREITAVVRSTRKIDDILDTMMVLLVDKMNDENEKIIDIDIRFLEEAMQEEVDRG